MSLYRQVRRPRATVIAVTAAVALIAGVAIGFAIGRSSAPDASARAAVEKLRAELGPIADGLELIPGEYRQAYAGQGVEQTGVADIIERLQTHLRQAAPDLQALDPSAARELRQRLGALQSAIRAHAPPSEVGDLAGAAKSALAVTPGGR